MEDIWLMSWRDRLVRLHDDDDWPDFVSLQRLAFSVLMIGIGIATIFAGGTFLALVPLFAASVSLFAWRARRRKRRARTREQG